MNYLTDLFTVETYEAFLKSDRTISGFRENQLGMANRVKPGDRLLMYIKGLSRWAGVLEILTGPVIDRTPLFLPENDPFVVRFRVKPISVLPLEQGIPIREEAVFTALSFTKGREKGYWLGPLRRSLQVIDDQDGRLLEVLLVKQSTEPTVYALDQSQIDQLRPKHVRRADGSIGVTVPRNDPEVDCTPLKADRDSIRAQADLARLGESMGFRIWLPRNDRSAVLHHWKAADGTLLDHLPLNYDDTTLETIEQIDVLWLRGR